jgi:hypothetical protein
MWSQSLASYVRLMRSFFRNQDFRIFYDDLDSSLVWCQISLQKFVILPKEKTAVWVNQNVNFFQQNGSVIEIEQN